MHVVVPSQPSQSFKRFASLPRSRSKSSEPDARTPPDLVTPLTMKRQHGKRSLDRCLLANLVVVLAPQPSSSSTLTLIASASGLLVRSIGSTDSEKKASFRTASLRDLSSYRRFQFHWWFLGCNTYLCRFYHCTRPTMLSPRIVVIIPPLVEAKRKEKKEKVSVRKRKCGWEVRMTEQTWFLANTRYTAHSWVSHRWCTNPLRG